jgi:hypothetical protein
MFVPSLSGQMIAFLGNVDEEEEKDATFPLTCELPRGTINVDRPEAIVRVHSCRNASFLSRFFECFPYVCPEPVLVKRSQFDLRV